MSFTAHNIVLPDGTETLPGKQPIADTGLCKAALRDLQLAFPHTPRSAVTVADLGCLEGGYAVEFARAGFRSKGIEANADNYAACLEVKEKLGLPNLWFEQGDVRDIRDRYDAIFCSGLLYHLDKPVSFLRLLGLITNRIVIINTHYSVMPITENEGYAGHWFRENPSRWSSNVNTASFWLEKKALMHCMREVGGFDLVYEQADYRDDILTETYYHPPGNKEVSRGTFVGIKL